MKSALLFLISTYQKIVSPWLGNRCRFFPTCSEWARQAVQTYGVWRGLALATKRLLMCHPFHPGGYDPLPTAKIHG
ncbi:MAG: membrane protein insertion efficiency factor YidD [Candidatus Omnitrophica bacterium]|nr:membrane protein insertion efficiency factor YidD [Candidatus Omnitrophota bacterium]